MPKIVVTDEMVDAAVDAYDDAPPDWEGNGEMKAAIEAALAVAPDTAAAPGIPDELVDVFDEAFEDAPGDYRASAAAGLAAVFAHLGQQDSDDSDDEMLRLRCLELAVEYATSPAGFGIDALHLAEDWFAFVRPT